MIATASAEQTPFALGTFETKPGERIAGIVVGDQVIDVTRRLGDASVLDLLERWSDVLPTLVNLAGETPDWPDYHLLRVCSPVQPRQVIQTGANYRSHVLQIAATYEDPAGRTPEQIRADTERRLDQQAASGVPYLFLGLPTVMAGAFDDLVLPAYSDRHDWELELAVVMGRRAFRVGRAEALDFVAGYTIINDITTRDRVFRKDLPALGTDWLRAKNAPGFLPTGPFIVPRIFVADPAQLRVTLQLNGELMQDETTADMVFDVAALVEAASQTVPLLPGDVIATGSPAGNGQHLGRFLQPGDVVEGTITGADGISLGTQRFTAIAGLERR